VDFAEILNKGDESGNGMIARFRLPSGLEVIGAPTGNFYGNGWDLGPTWNYAVLADRPFLVDSGRFGQAGNLLAMLAAAGVSEKDLAFVLISHGHEDHDGGLAELVGRTRLGVRAHAIYGRLIQRRPEFAPAGHKHLFPAKCWHCFMPESFSTASCLDYHRAIESLAVEPIGDGRTAIGEGLETLHLPGHSPDCLAVLLGQEAVIVGDVVLPGITPWPTREAAHAEVAPVLGEDYADPQALFGLRRYIRSLKTLRQAAAENPDILVLPAHRLYFKGGWNGLRLAERIDELIAHHVARCGAILEILRNGPQTVDRIAQAYFEAKLLKGFGSLMAANEILSHLELLESAGDVLAPAPAEEAFCVTGTAHFEQAIARLAAVGPAD
jgi:glyoxylase-like metal-dependent hydrolase (beta-lactamase superfamily II)